MLLNLVYLIIAAVIGYLCGAIPFGYIYVKLKTGRDIRSVGSGRTGGTNSLRAAGLGVGLATSFSDVFKGFLGVWLTRQLIGAAIAPAWLPWAIITAGLFAVIGHNWSVFIGWRGGAGTGPNVGWAMAIWWPMLPISVLVMGGMLLIIGIASIASMSMAAIIPIAFLILYATGNLSTSVYIFGGIFTAAVVLWALRPNIRRLIDGQERVVGPRAKRIKARNAKS